MRRVATLLISPVLVLLLTAPAVLAAQTSAFAGHWEAIDPLDGSELDAHIFGGAPVLRIVYTDQGAPVTCDGSGTPIFESFNTAIVDGDDFVSTMRVAMCGTLNLHFTGLQIEWSLDDQGNDDPSDDVITNSFGEFFTRAS
jgi:hypothetical protein